MFLVVIRLLDDDNPALYPLVMKENEPHNDTNDGGGDCDGIC